MTELTTNKIEDQVVSESLSQDLDLTSSKTVPLKTALILTASIFCLALGITLIQNLKSTSLSLATLFDSNAYIMSTQYILKACHKMASGAISGQDAAKSLVETIMLNGPILPGLGALYFTALGKTPSLVDMRAPIVLQAILHASASAFLALAGWRMMGKKRIGLLAGLLLALYPAAILGAGRFLSETISTLAIAANLAACGLLLRRNQLNEPAHKLRISLFAAFAFGFTAAVLVLLKPALGPGIVLELIAVFLLLFAAHRSLKPIVSAAIVSAIGLVITILPWLIYTQVATGHLYLTPQRNPTFNIAAGLNPETDGWSALPETPLVGLFSESDGPAAVAYSIFKLDQGDFISRMIRKPARLFQYPWNDTRFALLGIGGLTFQIIWHQLLISLAFLGMLLLLSTPLKIDKAAEKDATQIIFQLVCTASLILLFAHFMYLPFVANSRYGFTAMPCILLFSTLCIANLVEQRSLARGIYALLALVFMICAFSLNDVSFRSLFATSVPSIMNAQIALSSLLLIGAGLTAAKCVFGKLTGLSRSQILATTISVLALSAITTASFASRDATYDFVANLDPGTVLGRNFTLPKKLNGVSYASVLVNLRGDWRDAQLKVNGTTIQNSPTSLVHLNGEQELANAYKTFCAIFGHKTSGLDQWRAFPIPVNLLKAGEKNSLTIEGKQSSCALTGCTTGGITSEKSLVYGPSMTIFSPTKLTNDLLSNDARLRELMPVSTVDANSFRQENGEKSSADLSVSPGIQNGQYHMFLLLDESSKDTQFSLDLTTTPRIVDLKEKSKRNSKKKATKLVPFERTGKIPASAMSASHIKFHLTGEVESAAPLDVHMEIADQHLLASPCDLATFPAVLDGTGKRSFSVTAIAQSNLFDSRYTSAMIKISSNRVPLSISQIRLEVSSLQTPVSLNRGQRWF